VVPSQVTMSISTSEVSSPDNLSALGSSSLQWMDGGWVDGWRGNGPVRKINDYPPIEWAQTLFSSSSLAPR